MRDLQAEARIRAAVDRITQPSQRLIDHDDHGTIWGTVPSLWDQATIALIGTEHDSTGPGGDPAERNICDLDLMEIRCIIRETTVAELRRLRVTRKGVVPEQLLRLASTVITKEPDQLWWWEYRFTSWARLLETYLGDVDRVNRDRYIRDACLKCKARGVIDGKTGERVWLPALKVVFRDGYFRGIECRACAHFTWPEEVPQMAEAMSV